MKKILFSIAAAVLTMTSCSMDEQPQGTLNDVTAIETLQDAAKFRNGIYYNLRGITNGGYVYYTEFQADMFVGTQINGNRLGVLSLGNIVSSTDDLEGLWSGPYAGIANTNYFLPKLDAMIEGAASEEDKARLTQYRGETYFARAYYYYFLAEKYCNSYTNIDPTTAASGVPLVTTYAPSGEYGSYPGRSTLAETYAQIESDLTNAYNDLTTFEGSTLSDAKDYLAPNASYLSSNVVLAFQARLALLKGDYATAVTKAEAVIGTGKYELCKIEDFQTMWTDDESTELLFVPYGNQAQSPAIAAIGSAWINAKMDEADYVATENALSLYDGYNDVRYEWFFEPRTLAVNGLNVDSPCFVKYPGNPALNTTSTNALKNLSKPFRLSETYLILAEAAAQLGQTDKANSALNELRKNRLYDFTEVSYTGQTLINEIHNERTKELIGEGFRMSDLRRWKEGFSRNTTYTDPIYEDVPAILISAGRTVSYQAGDHRFLLPIPTSEMETNPQLAGEQNPGY